MSNKEVRTQQLVDHLFRHESGKITAHLIRKFGSSHIEVIEDAVQHALLRAMQTWPFREVPHNQSAWILRSANNYIIDQFRKNNKLSDADLSSAIIDSKDIHPDPDDNMKDDLLKMMFACCHPDISIEYRIILALKILCGFSNREVARALVKSEDAIAKGYTRAKTRFKEKNLTLVLPMGRDLNNRLDVVLKVIYVLFNEGYCSASDELLIRKDLCFEAIRLAGLLLENPFLRKPKVHGLMSLMCFQASRFDTRTNNKGELLTLEEQDRTCWDRALIQKGLDHLQMSYAFGIISEYHIEATIAAYHATSTDFSTTDWESIYHAYLVLEKINPSVIVQLNRIVAEDMFMGPEKAMDSLVKIENRPDIRRTYLFFAIKGSLLEKTGEFEMALDYYKKATKNTSNKTELLHLEKKIARLTKKILVRPSS